jgi:hypothetical protein
MGEHFMFTFSKLISLILISLMNLVLKRQSLEVY